MAGHRGPGGLDRAFRRGAGESAQGGRHRSSVGPVRAWPVKYEDLVAVLGHLGPQVHGGDGLVRGLGDHPRREQSGEVVLGGQQVKVRHGRFGVNACCTSGENVSGRHT
ncbi:hypothetical protein ACFV2N_44125 [Streptomyces sp. NPDC059680]|uniref:hypothetical protein n=1 Tax=Streptomyces sp. NPDC059680 TaxID=3346904 RepID=UPI0036953AB8